MMRDSQQLSLQVDTHTSTMAVQAISPIPLKDLSLLSYENHDEDVADENFSLNLSEDEDEENASKNKVANEDSPKEESSSIESLEIEELNDGKNEQTSVNNSETVSEIVNKSQDNSVENINSEDNVDEKMDSEESLSTSDTKQTSVDESKTDEAVNKVNDLSEEMEEILETTEEKLPNDKKLEDKEKIDNLEKVDDCEKTDDQKNTDELEKMDVQEKTNDQEKVDDCEKTDDQAKTIDQEKTDNLEKINDQDKTNDLEKMDVPDKTDSQEKSDDQEKANAEILKTQVMDTEDLLQIVENDTEENDKDSLKSGDKADSEDNETETDKNDVDEEDEDQGEEDKGGDLDIEENDLSKDIEAQLEKEYQDIVNDATAEANKLETPKDVPAEKSSVSEMDISVETSESKENDEEVPITSTSNIEEDIETAKATPPKDQDLQIRSPKPAKRSLEDTPEKVEAKKAKLDSTIADETVPLEMDLTTDESEAATAENSEETIKKPMLSTISKYLQKKMLKDLTYEDLEEICMQKICEAICYKSEIGELRHQLGVQEQMAEMWRKEVAQLSKQARDLEIVNKRLLYEVRLKHEHGKPLVPVKITRSVGLQVRSDTAMMSNVLQQKGRPANRIRPSQSFTPSTPAVQNRTPTPNRTVVPVRTPPLAKTATPTRTLTPTRPLPPLRPTQNRSLIKPQQSNQKTKLISPKGTLLNQALQNSSVSSTNTTTTSTVAVSSSNSASNVTTTASKLNVATNKVVPKKPITNKGVIDLTDEDVTPTKTTSSTAKATQGIRIVPTNKTAVSSPTGIVSPSRIMYVYNNQFHQGVLHPGNQKVMLKLGSPNGVLTSVANGSSISVSGTTVRAGAVSQVKLSNQVTTTRTTASTAKTTGKHPAPLPTPPVSQLSLTARKPIPPKPHLSIKRSSGGIVLSWKMPYILDNYETIVSYQLYAYQETSAPPSSDMWRKVGDVKALALPMACTLTQFADGNKYHFAVRAVDVHKRMGPFSDSEQILL